MTPTSLDIKLKNAIRIDRAIKFVWQSSPLYTTLSGLVMFIQGFLPLIYLYLIKHIIDSIAKNGFSIEGGLAGLELSTPMFYIGLACGVGLLTAFFNYLADYMKKAQSLMVADHMFSVLHKKALEADLAYYESPEYRNTLFRAQQEGPYRPASIVNGLFMTIRSGASFICIFGLLFLYNPILAMILIISAIPGILLRLTYSDKIYSWQEKTTEDERKAYYFHWMITGDGYAKELKLFDLGQYFMDQFKTIRDRLKQEKLHYEKKRAFGDFISQSSSTLAVFGSFVYIAIQTSQGNMTIGDMVMYFQGFQIGLSQLKSLLENGAQMYEDNLFLSNLYDFLRLEPNIKEPEHAIPAPSKMKTGIDFKNVEFFYQNNEKNVINCVNFSIHPGEMVALVGENGSGKSTIVKLLTRLYDPQKGEIFLDGQNIKNFKTQDLRKKISVLFQDPIRYQLSVKENIFLSDLGHKADFEKMQYAAKQTGINRLIENLPLGYDTLLGGWFKNGEELSAGQWQTIGISRTFFRDADIIILDEPANTLDPQTEMIVFSILKRQKRDQAILIISHKFDTIKMADRILVLDKGKIVEQGSHEQLINQNGRYSNLYGTQINSDRIFSDMT